MTRLSISKYCVSVCLFGLALFAVGQSGSRVLLVDKESRVEISSYVGFNVKSLPNGKSRIIATGKPLNVVWTTRSMLLQTPRFEGIVKQEGKSGLALESASMTGDLFMELKQASANPASKEPASMTLDAGGGAYTASDNVVKLTGKTLIKQVDPGTQRRLTIAGGASTITLYAPPTPKSARSLMKSANVAGPVTMTLITRRTEDGKTIDSNVVARGNSLVFDDAAGTIVLIGSVDIKGNDPVLIGDITASKVTLKLDAKWTIDEIDVEGEPVKTTMIKPPVRSARA